MNITTASQILNQRQAAKTAFKPEVQQQSSEQQSPQDSFQNSAFSVDRDIAYGVGVAGTAALSAFTDSINAGQMVSVGAGVTFGGLMAFNGIAEVMENKTAHGRFNGGVHAAVGLMTAAGPLLGAPGTLAAVSGVALLAKMAIDRPGNIAKKTAVEFGQMTKKAAVTPFKGLKNNSVE